MDIKARAALNDGRITDIQVSVTDNGKYITIKPETGDMDDMKYIDLAYNLADAEAGDSGYYIIPRGSNSPDDHICAFTEGEDAETDASAFQMAMYGFIRNKEGWCAIVTGYTCDYHLIIGRTSGKYHMYPRFYLEDGKPYEEISVRLYRLSGEDADYSGAARVYREYMMSERGCRLIRERENEILKYAGESLYVRIRLAWKPVPSPVEEQTDENEPPLHVAMTFDQVSDFIDRMKASGVEKAEICLVGWNISGHDGRWPQIFPVEPKLGGEERLRTLISHAKEIGYNICCHTNTTDSYSIADNYSPEITRKNRDGTIACHSWCWGGGRPRWVCPEKGLEIAKKELPRVAALGFRGLHYIDVISTIAAQPCYDKDHPETRRRCADVFRETAEYTHGLFGGFASEGGYDHTQPYLDYGLYISFYDTDSEKLPPLFTRPVPIWQIVYHGITLSNPYTSTVNSPIKSRRHQLEVIERGGRPTAYIYSKFQSSGSNWMGNDDLTCNDEKDTAHTAELLGEMYREFAPYACLQAQTIERHEFSDGVARTYYEDGSVMVTDYNTGTYRLEKADTSVD